MKKNYRLGICLWASYGLLACTQEVKVYTTSETEIWKQAVVEVQSADGTVPDIVISDEQEQSFDGFGGSFGEIGWDALALLPEERREEVMQALFAPEGIHFAYGRIPMGANDFARDYYTCNDTAGDFEMRHFTIERDKQAMIPYVKAALKQNPELRLWTSPWTPPVWMKATRHYATAPGDHNDFTKENQWPNCSWTPASMANFIGRYLGPLFAQEHPEVDLYFGTFNCNRMADLDCVMQDTAAARYVRGIGLQWEGKDIVGEIHDKYPEMQLMQTENECGSGTFDWAAAEHTFDLIKTYLDGGVNTYMYFNMVLQDEGASSWGWKQNALVRVLSSTKEAVYTPEFYLLKHLSHFLKPGAHKLKVEKGNDVLAFRNPDGETVVFCMNREAAERGVRLVCSDKMMILNLQPKTFNTIIY